MLLLAGMVVKDAIGMVFEALVLGYTLFKTVKLRKTISATGPNTTLSGLLIHDGKSFIIG